MERFNQYRDRGSGIAPFLPVPLTPAPNCCPLPVRILLFLFRLPFFISICASYFIVLQWLPIGVLGKKAAYWGMLFIPSLWWMDLQVDGVRKGNLHKEQSRLPGRGSIIAASFTSPIDALYLAAIFDPVFTASYPGTREVEEMSLGSAMMRALDAPQLVPQRGAKMTTLSALEKKHPNRPIVAFAECTTTNGRGILPLSPCLTGISSTAKIFPVSLRYQPEDITTPIPGQYILFLWALLSKPTHLVRVRIAEPATNNGTAGGISQKMKDSTYGTNYLDVMDEVSASGRGSAASEDEDKIDLSNAEKNLLDTVGESLARLGRARRVGLTVSDKIGFLREWKRQ